ncbi:MAG: PQQ-dependent sugar dehydrogenase [Candidatus Zixiibacteriota bacterium]
MTQTGILPVVAVLAAAALVASPVPAATPLTTVQIGGTFTQPLFITSPPGDTTRLFIVERTGKIKIWRAGATLSRPFIDVASLITSSGTEQGLLGLAFHPNYATNGYFFLNFTNTSGNTVVTRFSVSSDPDSASIATRHDYLTINQPFSNHNGGMIGFGPFDGYLYIGMGDGGSAGDPNNNAQNPLSLLGKMLRIDVSADTVIIPPSNPFVDSANYRHEIWSLGVRNPWRWSFDRQTGDLYIADVGQNVIEEIDFQPGSSSGGENYGWRRKEGLNCYNPPTNCEAGFTLVDPIYQYTHSGGRCSISGGYVYRGCAIPDLQGTYFFADYCTGEIWSFTYDGSGITGFQNRNTELGLTSSGVASFGEDARGELYVVNLNAGRVYKIVPNGVPSQCSLGCCTGTTGNVDGDLGDLSDISDLGALVDYLFFGGAITSCPDEANVDGSLGGVIDISDLNRMVSFLFFSSALPLCP